MAEAHDDDTDVCHVCVAPDARRTRPLCLRLWNVEFLRIRWTVCVTGASRHSSRSGCRGVEEDSRVLQGNWRAWVWIVGGPRATAPSLPSWP
jgi:hypothetical protein